LFLLIFTPFLAKNMTNMISITGAKTHNLKNISLDIPKNSLVVITGVSGSGKSSLAFETIFAEGQRRYVESLSAYARQFLGVMDKPDVENITGLSPAISIEQKTASRSPRSTVGTTTEIYDYLRLLYAKVGTPHCPECGEVVEKSSLSQIVDQIADFPEGEKIMLLAPVVRGKKGEHRKILEDIKRGGFLRYRVDGEVYTMAQDFPELEKNKKHTIEIVVDRLSVSNLKAITKTLSTGEEIEMPNPDRSRLADSVEICLDKGNGIITVLNATTEKEETFSENFACSVHGAVIPEIEARSFSFNSPYGACEECHGMGKRLTAVPEKIIPNKKLSIAEGAIHVWNVSNTGSWYLKLLTEVGKSHGFDMNTPVSKLSPEIIDILLYGTGDEEYQIEFETEKNSGNHIAKFEGVISNIERRYLETDSEHMKKTLEQYMDEKVCPSCNGYRLRKEVLKITVADKNIIEATEFSIGEARKFFQGVYETLSHTKQKIAQPILHEIEERLKFLEKVGLSYLTLNRSSATLSGGEAQRIRLATQIGSKLEGVLYVLDEPSIGLHQRDNEKLIETMRELQELGNTVLVVEHDEDTMKAADYLIEIGPQAGQYGGEVVNQGTPKEFFLNENSSTADYLSGRKTITVPKKRRKGNGKFLEITGATFNNLKNLDVQFPLGTFIGISGVSGSGKSSLINGVLAPHLLNDLNNAKREVGAYKTFTGIEHLDKTIVIDQSAIGKSPRSNPATYTKTFDEIRSLFAEATEAKLRGYKLGRFSFNVKGGRCEACQGDGTKKIEMHFLPDVYVECEVCKGKRYNAETLQVTWRGKNIADVLEMTVAEGVKFFEKVPNIHRKLQSLQQVGLGYLQLGQSATTLSGGEAQRIKLATELSKRSTGKTFYILDEPTTGLHFEDTQKLLDVLQDLVDKGNTVLVIEHNLDVIKCCDTVFDIGPEGGSAGGFIVAQGTPETISECKESHTGKFLKKML
jgi:excinuclease ABC subunit A